MLIGFRERKSRYVADMQVCKVGKPPVVGNMLMPLRALIAAMAERDRLPQIASWPWGRSDCAGAAPRKPLPAGDLQLLRDFAAAWRCSGGSQPSGPRHRCTSLRRGRVTGPLSLPEFGMPHALPADRLHPGQPHINAASLVGRALLACAAARTCHRLVAALQRLHLPRWPRRREVLGIEGSGSGAALARERAVNGASRSQTSFVAHATSSR